MFFTPTSTLYLFILLNILYLAYNFYIYLIFNSKFPIYPILSILYDIIYINLILGGKKKLETFLEQNSSKMNNIKSDFVKDILFPYIREHGFYYLKT